jgi:radical SAM protein (TIGR01212 family)
MEHGWRGLPFRPISQHYLSLFGEKVYKIPVAIADDCPNRRGLKGMKPCVFCDEWGSAARSEAFSLELKTQIEKYRSQIHDHYKANKFLIYFQAYTNTFLKLQSLRDHFQTALEYPFVHGLVVGTRPDCISKGVFDLWNETTKKVPVFVELGVQSFVNEHLKFMQRGHTAEDSIHAIKKIARETKVDIGIHLIFGSPGETDADIIESAQICSRLPISNVKLHHLHVLRNTPLEELYSKGLFTPIDFETYRHRVRLFLEHLSPEIYVQRLAAYSSRWSDLIAPEWTKTRMKTHQGIVDHMRENQSFQSRFFQPQTEMQRTLQQTLNLQSLPTHQTL